jgi:hypothetical protein
LELPIVDSVQPPARLWIDVGRRRGVSEELPDKEITYRHVRVPRCSRAGILLIARREKIQQNPYIQRYIFSASLQVVARS